jgi:plasmid stabilization system protein ParE
LASWKQAARRDLEGIWRHHLRHNGLEYANGVTEWLLSVAEHIDPGRCPLLNEDTRKYVKDGYVFMVRPLQTEVEIVGVFGPGQNWTTWIGRR